MKKNHGRSYLGCTVVDEIAEGVESGNGDKALDPGNATQ
jgi:hypothetical protein